MIVMEVPLVGEAEGMGGTGGSMWELSALTVHFCYDPKTALCRN